MSKKWETMNADYWESFNDSLPCDNTSAEVSEEFLKSPKTNTFKSFNLDDPETSSDFTTTPISSTDNSLFYDIDEDDDDSFLGALAPKKAKTLKDYYSNDDDDNNTDINVFSSLLSSSLNASETLSDVGRDAPGDSTVIHSADNSTVSPQTVTPQPPVTPTKKDNSKKLTLEDMQNAIMQKVTLISHDGGLYYYTGTTYKALGNYYDLLSLVRSQISTTAFASASVKHFFDLFVYLKADKRLIPTDYQKRLNKSKYVVVLRDGILNLKTLEMSPHSPHYLTFHEYDVEFTEKKPKVFLRFLEQASGGDLEITQRIVEAVGYLLSSINNRYFFVAGCAHRSGKSTLGLLLEAIIGAEYVSTISTHQLDRKFALGGIRGKIINLAMDVPKGHLSDVSVSLIKSCCGGDSILIEEKYQPVESLTPGIRFLLGTNYKISVSQSDDEDAFWERMIILPFQYSVPTYKVDHLMVDKMVEEKDRIISYCLRALSHVLSNNLQFSPCRVAEEMRADWRNASPDTSSFELYWNEEISATGDENDEVFALDLYEQYKRFCLERDLNIAPYQNVKMWIASNIPASDCWHKRIHKTGENPKSGFAGIKFNKI